MRQSSSENPVLHAVREKMRAAHQSEEAIAHFTSALTRLRAGAATVMPSAELEPVADVPELQDAAARRGGDALRRLAVIKLNGGLATSMGLQHPKSLIEAREGRSFLEIIVGQTLALRRRHDVRLPLVLMDSDVTRAETRSALRDSRSSRSMGWNWTSCRAWSRNSTRTR